MRTHRLYFATLILVLGTCAGLVFPLAGRGVSAAPIHGTFSIVGCDTTTGELGIAVQSRAFAVGNFVPWAQAGVGAIATQANTNSAWGPNGIQMLREGVSVQKMVDSLVGADPEFMTRQIGALDRRGWPAGYTGNQTLAWSGGLLDTCVAAQGNILANHLVVQAMVDTFRMNQSATLADRLLGALVAGQARGGDRRGMQSAALLVVRPSREHPEYDSRYIYVRVDDHSDPIRELIRLYRMYEGTRLVGAHFHYADLYRKAGMTGRAERETGRIGEILERTLADSAATASSLNGLAWEMATHDLMLPRALVAADRALALEPRNVEILDTAAEVRYRMDQYDEAIRIAREAVALSPGDEYLAAQLVRFEKGKAEARSKAKKTKSGSRGGRGRTG